MSEGYNILCLIEPGPGPLLLTSININPNMDK